MQREKMGFDQFQMNFFFAFVLPPSPSFFFFFFPFLILFSPKIHFQDLIKGMFSSLKGCMRLLQEILLCNLLFYKKTLGAECIWIIRFRKHRVFSVSMKCIHRLFFHQNACNRSLWLFFTVYFCGWWQRAAQIRKNGCMAFNAQAVCKGLAGLQSLPGFLTM